MNQSNSSFSNLSPKQMFLFGLVAGVLILCTIGFFILLSIMLRGDGLAGVKARGNAAVAVQPSPSPAAPTAAAPVGDVPPVTKDDHARGAKNAKVTLIEYSDFECPFCSRFFPTTKQVLQDYPNDVRLVYRHFPLSFHPQAQPAAEASECAAEQGKFWEFHDGIFENQSRLGEALYKELAGKFGLNAAKFNDCLSAGKYRGKVQQQQAGGTAAGVGGTPHTIVLGPNGENIPLSGALPYEQIKAAIDSLLN